MQNISDRSYIKEALIVMPLFLGTLYLVGKIVDRFFQGEEKAQEAKRKGFDI